MITGATSLNLPSLKVVIPYFLLSAVSLVALSFLLFLASSSVSGHYFQPKILAITHIGTIGFISSMIFGAMYQMLPVVMEVKVWSEKIAIAGFVLLLLGLVILTWSFWHFNLGLPALIGGWSVFLSFLLFAINFFVSVANKKDFKEEGGLIYTSVIWLVLTGLLGLLLVYNFTSPFIPLSHLEVLKIHAHMGLAGWFFLMIEGVGAKFIPMFFLSHPKSKLFLNVSLVLNNLGLLGYCLSIWYALESLITILFITLMIAGALCFCLYIFNAWRNRVRKKADSAMGLTMVAFLFLLPVLILGAFMPMIQVSEKSLALMAISYGTLAILGFCGLLIIGQSLKIIPFIIWISRYRKWAGRKDVPQPGDLISERQTTIVSWVFPIGVILIAVSAPLSIYSGVLTGAILLTLASSLYLLIIIKVLIHKPINSYENSNR